MDLESKNSRMIPILAEALDGIENGITGVAIKRTAKSAEAGGFQFGTDGRLIPGPLVAAVPKDVLE